jgi:hypothetical protein
MGYISFSHIKGRAKNSSVVSCDFMEKLVGFPSFQGEMLKLELGVKKLQSKQFYDISVKRWRKGAGCQNFS